MNQSSAPTAAGVKPLNILIVDDSATMRAVIRRVVSLTEVPVGTIHEAANGRAALKILESEIETREEICHFFAHDVDAHFRQVGFHKGRRATLVR